MPRLVSKEDIGELEIALGILGHIHDPCVEPITGQNVRHVYIRLAEDTLRGGIKYPLARKMLQEAIRGYQE